MEFPTYNRRSVSKDEFLRFWSLTYRYSADYLYDDNIGRPLTPDRIRALFRWKNGTVLSDDKMASVEENFILRRKKLKAFKPNFTAEAFLDIFDQGGETWRIFWLHCFSPSRFPIFDQHVNRAMTYLQDGVPQEIAASGRVEQYVAAYIPFYEEFAGSDRRQADKALWAFGKFLKNWDFPDQSALT